VIKNEKRRDDGDTDGEQPPSPPHLLLDRAVLIGGGPTLTPRALRVQEGNDARNREANRTEDQVSGTRSIGCEDDPPDRYYH
jgi:hypothetical protein